MPYFCAIFRRKRSFLINLSENYISYYENDLLGGIVMKITDMVISAILKKGILYEARNVDTDVEIPMVIENQERKIKINIKCEHMTLRIEKE
jgi:hypothetical protein